MKVGCAGDESCNMRYGKSDERHWTAESCGDSGEDADGYEHHGAHIIEVHAQVEGIVLAQLQQVEGLCHGQCHDDAYRCYAAHDGKLGETDIAETAHSPAYVAVNILYSGEEVEQCDNG